jgi:uridine kinase
MINVKYSNISFEINNDTTVLEFLNNIPDLNKELILACKVNNEVKALDYVIKNDCSIELIDYKTPDGSRIYVRGLTFIMIKAFEELYPNIKITVNYSLGHSIYSDVSNAVSEEMLSNVKSRMEQIIAKDIPFIKKEISLEEAIELYRKDGRLDQIELLDNSNRAHVSVYYCEDTYNYFYGIMPISTKFIKYFDLLLYDKGILLVYPRRFNPTAIEKIKDTKKLYETFNEYDKIHKIIGIEDVAALNSYIKAGTIGDIIRLSEALHEKKLAQIADKIAQDRKKRIVLIAGPSSSGKTTFAQRLGIQLELNGIKTVTLSVDNYFVNREDNPKDENGNYDFECLEAIDLDLFNKQLSALLNGEEIKLPTFDFTTGSRVFLGNTAKLNEDEVLVIEGIHGLNEKLTKSIPRDVKFKIYISALTALNIDDYNRISTTDSRLIRRMVRDYKYRSHEAITTLKMWPSVRDGEEKYIFPFQEDADVMFNSSLVYEISVLKAFAEPLLATVSQTDPEYSEAKRLYNFLGYFLPIGDGEIPINSLIREFIGGGCFNR